MTMTMTMLPRSVGSLPVRKGLTYPECISVWDSVHSLLGEHARIIQETTVLVCLCMPRATWYEAGLYLEMEMEMCFTHVEERVSLKGSLLCVLCVLFVCGECIQSRRGDFWLPLRVSWLLSCRLSALV